MNTHAKKFSIHLAGALALAFSGAGCIGVSDEPAPEELEGVGETAKLVYTLDQGNGHTLEFYDAGDGQIAVKEELFVGDALLLDKMETRNYTLEELYRHVRPSGEIPRSILDTDIHAKAVLGRLETLRVTRPDFRLPGATPAAGTTSVDSTKSSEVELAQGAVVSCSSDILGDNWGAQWWIDNFTRWWDNPNSHCTSGFTTTRHGENWGNVHLEWGGGNYWQYKQLEGDHQTSGQFKIYRTGFPYPTAKVFGQGPVAPRKMVVWNISGGMSWQTNHASGSSPCGHLMWTQVWCG
jgi:hypothetical protein